MSNDDKRLIEDYLPIVAISAEASREKSVRKGHISTLHLWWARRPLVACRAAVYGALVPASQFVPNGGTDAQKKGLGRANAAKFITSLCQYPGSPQIIKEAQQHILRAHAERLSRETGKKITVEDIVAGHAPRPRVLDMFAGGGAIPLEALRLGCEAYALDLNPVAYIIQLCTLVYPQKFGKPDIKARGMAGPENEKGETTWGGLADEVRYWGNWILEKVHAQIGDLYPLIPDPEFTTRKKRKDGKDNDPFAEPQDVMGFADDPQQQLKARTGFLSPVAYLWTRTVQCNNPKCGATVPLARQTWLCKKDKRSVALKMIASKGQKRVRFEVVEAPSASALGFDPEALSKAGNAVCPFCGTVANAEYVRAEGVGQRIGYQLMAVICVNPETRTTCYLAAQSAEGAVPEDSTMRDRIAKTCQEGNISIPEEPIEANPRSMDTQNFGFESWASLFTNRQLLSLLTLTAAIRRCRSEMENRKCNHAGAVAVSTLLALALNRLANYSTTLCVWRSNRTCVLPTFARQALPMVWDFGEMNPFAGSAGDWSESIDYVCATVENSTALPDSSRVVRGSATDAPFPSASIDAVVTDPPYYDNVSYSNLSDFFFVWLKRTVGDLYTEHFAAKATPKRKEIIAAFYRHGGDRAAARSFYEQSMTKAFSEAYRMLKPGGSMTVVYAHKTTLGWATLVDALRVAGFQVTEAWPIDTEMTGGMRTDKASLATSIFLFARKREGETTGNYEEQVRSELETIVRERVETLWDMGISGADLVIASVGAGLRAFTRFASVEYANGEEVPAERFLTEVEIVVLETILARLSREVGGKGGQYSLASLDTASRFYVLWRYTYGAAELDAGEAIIFANGTHVELDGQHGLTAGADALVEKKKGNYRLRDFSERGSNDKIGLPSENGQPAPLVDALQRTLWLMENRPTELSTFLREAQPNREALRLVAQALAGPALKGGEMGDISPTAELSALAKLTANWQSVVEDAAQTTGEKEERKKGQKQLI
jgi:putative DNA methylase